MMHNFVDGISWDSRFAMGEDGSQKIREICGAPWGLFFGGEDSRQLNISIYSGSDFEGFFWDFPRNSECSVF